MCAHLMLFTAICRPNLSVLAGTGAWDIGFLLGGMGPVYSAHVAPGQCVCWGLVTALILVGLTLSQLALERHAIFRLWPKLFDFSGGYHELFVHFMGVSTDACVHDICFWNSFGFYLFSCCFICVFTLLPCAISLAFVAVFPLPPMGLAVCKSGICIGFSLILVC